MSAAAGSSPGLAGEKGRDRALRTIAGPDGIFLLVARLTLFLLLFHAGDGWYFKVPVTVLAIGGFLWKRLLHDPLYWVAFTVFLAHGNYLNWDINDNHQYLINYWCLAIACCLVAGEPEMLRAVARVMLGLSMLLAVVWKALAPDYLDGSFFEFVLLRDSRFEPAVIFFTELTGEALAANRALWGSLQASESVVAETVLQGVDQVRGLACVLSWWGIGIEALLAVLFLVPGRLRVRWWGHVILLVFIFTTYGVAPVVGFGWILCVLGIAACDREATGMRIAYLAAFLVVFLFNVPISAHFQVVYDTVLPLSH